MTETSLQIAIMSHLRSLGLLAIHVPNEGFRTAREAAIQKKMGVLAGVPDILVLDLGVAIEVKLPGGKPTKAQDMMLRALRACGWEVGVAHSLEEAREIVNRRMGNRES